MRILLASFALVALSISSDASGSEEVRGAFDEYLEQKSLFFSLPPGSNEAHEAAFMASRDDLYQYGDDAVSFFADQLKSSKRKGYRVEILDFLAEDGFGKEEILPIVRKLVAEADLEDLYPAVTAACARYLAGNGEAQDIRLLRRLEEHNNPGVVLAAKVGSKRLSGVPVQASVEEQGNFEGRQKAVKAPLHEAPDATSDQGETETATKEAGQRFGGETVESPGFPKWALAVIVVPVLGILALLLRAFLRGRAS